MKKPIIFISAIAILFTGCSTDIEVVEPNEHGEYKVETRSRSTTFDLCTQCELCDGSTVNLPWNTDVPGSVPEEVRYDVKESDGWRILYSTVEIIGYDHTVHTGTQSNYLLLYNKFTGVLKGFYYATSMQPNNHAFFQLTIPASQQTKLFNFVSEFAVPSDSTSTNSVLLSAITDDGIAAGFEQGWNCFMVELSYDPNSLSETMGISGVCMNVTSHSLNGSIDAESEGVIMGANHKTSSFMSGIASVVGDVAKAYMDSVGIAGLVGVGLGGLAAVSATSLFSYGVNKIFGSLLTQSSTTVQNVQFTTNGKLSVTGTSSSPSSGLIAPIGSIPLNGTGERLGVWNLTEKPRYTIPSCPVLVKANINTMVQYIYKIELQCSIQYTVNPDVSATVSYSVVEYTKYDGSWVNPTPYQAASVSCGAFNTGEYPMLAQTELLNDGYTIIKSMPNSYTFYALEEMPNYISLDGKPACDLEYYVYDYLRPVKFKVVATVSANGNVVKSGKTFTPVFLKQKNGDTARSWSLSELASNGYVYLNGTQIWSLNGIHTIKPDSVLLMRNPESVSQ